MTGPSEIPPSLARRLRASLRHTFGLTQLRPSRVKRYGRGLVEEANTLQVTVAFSDGTRRCFQPEYVAHDKAGKRAREEVAA